LTAAIPPTCRHNTGGQELVGSRFGWTVASVMRVVRYHVHPSPPLPTHECPPSTDCTPLLSISPPCHQPAGTAVPPSPSHLRAPTCRRPAPAPRAAHSTQLCAQSAVCLISCKHVCGLAAVCFRSVNDDHVGVFILLHQGATLDIHPQNAAHQKGGLSLSPLDSLCLLLPSIRRNAPRAWRLRWRPPVKQTSPSALERTPRQTPGVGSTGWWLGVAWWCWLSSSF